MKISKNLIWIMIPVSALTLSLVAPDNAKELMSNNENARSVQDFETKSGDPRTLLEGKAQF